MSETNTAHKTNTLVCEVCGAHVSNLRRGRCWVCYIRWTETRPVGLGASCVVCGERRRDNLRYVEFQGRWLPMCHNCGTKALRFTPMPPSVEALRERLSRDRRWTDRRADGPDTRPFPRERRSDNRRGDASAKEDWLDAEELIVEENDDRMPETSGLHAAGCTIHNQVRPDRRGDCTGFELTCIAPMDSD